MKRNNSTIFNSNSIVYYSNYKSKIKQTLTYVQNISTIRQTFVEYKIEIVAIILL